MRLVRDRLGTHGFLSGTHGVNTMVSGARVASDGTAAENATGEVVSQRLKTIRQELVDRLQRGTDIQTQDMATEEARPELETAMEEYVRLVHHEHGATGAKDPEPWMDKATPNEGMRAEVIVATKGKVTELTDERYGVWVQDHDFTIVMYGATWEVFSQRLEKTWQELADRLQRERLSVAVGRVYCDKEPEICRKQVVSAFPTLVWFQRGDPYRTVVWRQDMTVEDIVRVVRHKLETTKTKIGGGDLNSDDSVNNMVAVENGDDDEVESSEATPTQEKHESDHPVSAYSLFYSEERERILSGDGSTGNLDKEIGRRWEGLDFYKKEAYRVKAAGVEQHKMVRKDGTSSGKDATTSKFVVPLTADNFDAKIRSQKLAFVNFASTECEWSQRLIPTWELLAERIAGEQLPMTVGMVDCDMQTALCDKQDIEVHPTLRWFREGIVGDPDYCGDRSVDALLSFILTKLDSTAQLMLPSHLRAVMNRDSIQVSPATTLEETTTVLFRSGKFQESDESVAADPLAAVDQQSSRSSATVIDTSASEEDEDALPNVATNAVSLPAQGSVGSVIKLTEENFDSWVQSKEVAFVNFASEHCYWSQQLAPMWEQLAKNLGEASILVGVVNCDNDPNLCMKQSIGEYPTLRWFKFGIRGSPDYHAEHLTEASLSSFIKSKLHTDVKTVEHKDLTNDADSILDGQVERLGVPLDDDILEKNAQSTEEYPQDKLPDQFVGGDDIGVPEGDSRSITAGEQPDLEFIPDEEEGPEAGMLDTPSGATEADGTFSMTPKGSREKMVGSGFEQQKTHGQDDREESPSEAREKTIQLAKAAIARIDAQVDIVLESSLNEILEPALVRGKGELVKLYEDNSDVDEEDLEFMKRDLEARLSDRMRKEIRSRLDSFAGRMAGNIENEIEKGEAYGTDYEIIQKGINQIADVAVKQMPVQANHDDVKKNLSTTLALVESDTINSYMAKKRKRERVMEGMRSQDLPWVMKDMPDRTVFDSSGPQTTA